MSEYSATATEVDSASLVHSARDDYLDQALNFDEIRAFISERVSDFLSTLGRGASATSAASFPLTAQGSLIDEVLSGFMTRIPVGLGDLADFNRLLVRDLLRASKDGFRVGEHAKVVVEGAELALQPLSVSIPTERPAWERATLYVPD